MTTRSATLGVAHGPDLHAADIASATARAALRRDLLRLYLATSGFFRCYPMYLVDEFHLALSRESELIAWVGVPIALANLWLTGALSRRFAMPTLTVWSAVLTGVLMVLVVIPSSQGAL